MKLKIIIAIFILIITFSLVGASDQLFVPCGGDDQLAIQCIGDDELGIFGDIEEKQGRGGIIPFGITDKINKKNILIASISILFFLFLTTTFIIIDKRRKIKKSKR